MGILQAVSNLDYVLNYQEGCDNGDEYQAELDYIETIEREKEGFEFNAIEPEDPHAYIRSQQIACEEMAAAMESSRSTSHSQKNLTKSSVEIKVKVVKEKRSATVKTEGESTACDPNIEKPKKRRRRKKTHRLHFHKESDATNKDQAEEYLKPGLGNTKGVTNLEEIMSAAAFDLKPVVQLTRLTPELARKTLFNNTLYLGVYFTSIPTQTSVSYLSFSHRRLP